MGEERAGSGVSWLNSNDRNGIKTSKLIDYLPVRDVSAMKPSSSQATEKELKRQENPAPELELPTHEWLWAYQNPDKQLSLASFWPAQQPQKERDSLQQRLQQHHTVIMALGN